MTSQPSTSNATVQEFSIRVPKNVQRKYHVMRFNGNLGVDFDKWSHVKMERENNMREFKGPDEEIPKYGAGSEFGREAKEEARRKKLGIITKKYRPDDQPWILKSHGSGVKKFKGIREGGVSANTAYYVFTHAEDGAIEAFPLHEWYKFQPIQRYKTLSAEEAELEFSNRNRNLNYFSLMLRKRLKGDGDAELDGEDDKSKKTSKKGKDLKISEMDEWINSSDADSDSDEEKKEKESDDDEGEKSKKKKKGKNVKGKAKKKRDTTLEALEDSDDGDEEGRELDYISDSSESGPENIELDGVAEEKGLKKLLNSDEEESEDSDNEQKDKNAEDEEKETEENDKKVDDDKDKKKKKKDKKKDIKKKKDDPDDDFSSDSTTDEDSKKKKGGDKKEKGGKKDEKSTPESASSSRSASPTVDNKRKLINDVMAPGPSKKMKLETSHIPGTSDSGSLEEAVRKYLIRKPLTTTELLQKIKSKKTGFGKSEDLVNTMTQILKKLNPIKQTLKGKMFLSLPKV